MNKKEYLYSIIKEAQNILSTAETQGHFLINQYTGQRYLDISKFSYKKWITKANEFLKKYNYTNCQVQINGQVPFSEIMLTKLAKLTALYESFELDNDCLDNLNFIPINVKILFNDMHYAESIFEAFKYIEVSVRNKSGLTDLYGMDLMKKAFGKSGILKNNNIPEGEQVAQMELFSGAIGFIKNPKSHNIVTISKDKAIELLYLANYLLRVLSEI
jgi:uncharacterized protein (TIGR02391 family)